MFFFSSRRRHTRCGRDWSSDVCSSDLIGSTDSLLYVVHVSCKESVEPIALAREKGWNVFGETCTQYFFIDYTHLRSEERRVGKECGSRGRTSDGKRTR